jgi:hypothetical protein
MDMPKIEQELEKYFTKVIERCCELTIQYFQKEIPLASSGVPGKTEWRKE